jgi:hypothetical protein
MLYRATIRGPPVSAPRKRGLACPMGLRGWHLRVISALAPGAARAVTRRARYR